MAIMPVVDHQTDKDQKPRKSRSRGPKGSGPGNVSKMVMDRVKDAETLRGGIVELRHLAAAGLGERLAPVLGEAEALPDHASSLELVCRRVLAGKERLLATDREYRGRVVRRLRQRRACES